MRRASPSAGPASDGSRRLRGRGVSAGRGTSERGCCLAAQPHCALGGNAAEVIDQLVRVFGRDPNDVYADLALLSHAGMEITWLSPEMGAHAGSLRARYYHRERMAVSLADCVAAATAIARQQPLATSDPALAALLRAEDGKVHGLPDSAGRMP
jgi:hypothetical protein